MKLIFLVLLAGILLLGGCEQHEENNMYIGMEQNTIPDLTVGTEMEYIHEFRGHSDHWAAVYIVYKPQGEENHTSKLMMKYISKKLNPSGELRYEYDTDGGEDGNGTLSSVDKAGHVYNLGSSGGNGQSANPKSPLQMHVWWNGDEETIQLDLVGKE